MTDQLTSAGLTIDDLSTRKSALKAAIRTACGANLDLSPDQPDGQFVEIFTETVQAALEVLQEVYAGFDRDEASGDALVSLCSLTGTNQREATKGTVTLTLTLDAGITVPALSVAHVSGDPANRWETDTDVTSVLAGNYTVTATCTQTGAVQALANTITVIATPVAGWTVVDNAASATEGLEIETDTELRLRAEQELALGGSATVAAIQADIISMGTTAGSETYCRVYENTTNGWDSEGRPPHSFEPVIWAVPALTDADITEQLWDSKPAGIRSWGSTTSSHTDDYGVSHELGYTIATDLVLEVYITLTKDATTYPGDSDLELALMEHIETLSVGDDVIWSQLVGICFDVPGVEDVAVTICWSGGAPAAANLTVAYNEVATLDSSDITIT